MLPGNERDDLEHGGKIIMPPSALDQLTRLNIVYPMLFKLTNPATSRTTHCGVLEFIADEGGSILIITGHALGIRIWGCSLFYKREL